MRYKWPKLASLAQKTCPLYTFSFLVYYLLPTANFLRTYLFDFTTAGDWDCVAVKERLPALQYCVDFIFLSFWIMGSIAKLASLAHNYFNCLASKIY